MPCHLHSQSGMSQVQSSSKDGPLAEWTPSAHRSSRMSSSCPWSWRFCHGMSMWSLGHVPYRKDRPTCTQSSQHIAPRRKDRFPQPGVLALDTGGPLPPANDLGSWKCKYFLAGSYTFMVPKGTEKMLPLPEEKDEELSWGSSPWSGCWWAWCWRSERCWGFAASHTAPTWWWCSGRWWGVAARRTGVAPVEMNPPERPLHEGSVRKLSRRKKKMPREAKKVRERKRCKYKGVQALPMRTKKSKEVTRTAMEMILKLTCMWIEFTATEATNKARGIILTRTSRDDPRANGRAEATVKAVKNQVRRVLMQAKVGSEWWPWALRYLNEVYRCQPKTWHTARLSQLLARCFGQEEKVEKRCLRAHCRDSQVSWPFKRRRMALDPSWRSSAKSDKVRHAKGAQRPDESVWLAVEREVADALTKRRRLREKTTVRRLKMIKEESSENEEEKQAKLRRQFTKVV